MKRKQQPTDQPDCTAIAHSRARTQRRIAKLINKHIVKPYRITKIFID